MLKVISLSPSLLLTLSAPTADKTQYFVHLSFNSTSYLAFLNGILSDLQKYFKYFNETAVVAYFLNSICMIRFSVF